MPVNYGTIALIPKGDWSAETQYKMGNVVTYDGSSYVAHTRPPVGTLPTNTDYWQVSAQGASRATADSLGVVKPDGVTLEVDSSGIMSAKTATQEAAGIVKGGSGITIGEDGSLDVNTTFEQATELANIIAGEAISQVLGKVSKAIAVTMDLDQHALLKNMLTNIDANDSTKVPTSAFIHTLYERIGMGTELALAAGENLTVAVNQLGYKELTLGFDLNNALGHYRTSNSAIVESLLNKPTGVTTGELTIDWYSTKNNNKYGYGTQIIRYSRGGNSYLYMRSKRNDVAWGEWVEVSNSSLQFTNFSTNDYAEFFVQKNSSTGVVAKGLEMHYANNTKLSFFYRDGKCYVSYWNGTEWIQRKIADFTTG